MGGFVGVVKGCEQGGWAGLILDAFFDEKCCVMGRDNGCKGNDGEVYGVENNDGNLLVNV